MRTQLESSWPRYLAWAVVLAALLAARASHGQEMTLSDYGPLLERTTETHAALQSADQGVLPALLEAAVDADTELIDFLDGFLETPEYQELSPEDQAVLRSGRSRAEFNRATALIRLDRCDEARDRLRALLDRPSVDEQLRPWLVQTYDDATLCALRERTVPLEVHATPAEAELLVDGVFVGMANATYEVAEGHHVLTARAPGYLSEEVELDAVEGQAAATSFALAAEEPPPEAALEAPNAGGELEAPAAAPTEAGGKPPHWYEWTLWGVGVAGIATGVGFYLSARGIEDDVDNPPPGTVVTDPGAEYDEADTRYAIGYVAGGLGIASAIIGTVLYLTRDADEPSPAVSWGGAFTPDHPFQVTWTF